MGVPGRVCCVPHHRISSASPLAAVRRLAFLAARPTFIKLQEREALAGGELLTMVPS